MSSIQLWYLVGAVFTLAMFMGKEPAEFKKWQGWTAALALSAIWPLSHVLMLGAVVGKKLR